MADADCHIRGSINPKTRHGKFPSSLALNAHHLSSFPPRLSRLVSFSLKTPPSYSVSSLPLFIDSTLMGPSQRSRCVFHTSHIYAAHSPQAQVYSLSIDTVTPGRPPNSLSFKWTIGYKLGERWQGAPASLPPSELYSEPGSD